MNLSLFLAIKTIIRGDKGSLILTILIMLVVFLNLLFIDGIFAGITATLDRGKIDYQYGEVIIEPKIGDLYIKDTNQIIDKIKDLYYIKAITKRVTTGAVLMNDKNNDGRDVSLFRAGVIGIDPERDNEAMDIRSNIIEGRYLEKNDQSKVMIGADAAGGQGSSVFAENLGGVHIGDNIVAEYENGISKKYEIIGIYRTKNFETDSKMFITQNDFNSVFSTTNEASEIIIRLTDKNLSAKALEDIQALGFEEYEIADWNDKLAFGRTINESFEKIGSILRVIGSFVAGLVIFIIIFVDIVNRRKQIGILKAIGIPESTIMYSYVFRGMFYTIVGMTLGYVIMRFGVINLFISHPIDFPMGWMIPVIKMKALQMSILLFVLAGLIGSFLPSTREVRKKILTLMR